MELKSWHRRMRERHELFAELRAVVKAAEKAYIRYPISPAGYETEYRKLQDSVIHGPKYRKVFRHVEDGLDCARLFPPQRSAEQPPLRAPASSIVARCVQRFIMAMNTPEVRHCGCRRGMGTSLLQLCLMLVPD